MATEWRISIKQDWRTNCLADRRVKTWYPSEPVVVGYNKTGCETNAKWAR